jgi:hypothetical protein
MYEVPETVGASFVLPMAEGMPSMGVEIATTSSVGNFPAFLARTTPDLKLGAERWGCLGCSSSARRYIKNYVKVCTFENNAWQGYRVPVYYSS